MGCAIPRNSIVVKPCTDECFTLWLVLGVVRGLCRVFLVSGGGAAAAAVVAAVVYVSRCVGLGVWGIIFSLSAFFCI